MSYIRLIVNDELSDKQEFIWNRFVEMFIGNQLDIIDFNKDNEDGSWT